MAHLFTTVALQLTSTDKVLVSWDLLFVLLYCYYIFATGSFLLYFETRSHVILISFDD